MEKYDGKGNIKGWASGVFMPVEGVLLYTPIEFGGKPVGQKFEKTWEENREKTRRSQGNSGLTTCPKFTPKA